MGPAKANRFKASLAFTAGALFAVAGLSVAVLDSASRLALAGLLIGVGNLGVLLGGRYIKQAVTIETQEQPKGGLFQKWQT